jgi:putative ABC transport system permease protein
MKFYDIFSLAFSALKDRKLRAVLTILGITVGPGTIVALIAVSQGFSIGIIDQFSRFGANTIIVIPSSSKVWLTNQDITTIENIEQVSIAVPFQQKIVTYNIGGKIASSTILAFDLTKISQLFPGISLDEGEFPDEFDLTGAIIGYNLASPTDPEQIPIRINQMLSISTSVNILGRATTVTRSYLVKGDLEKFGAGILGDIDNGIFITYRSGQSLTRTTRPAGVFVVVEDTDKVTNVSDRIASIFGDDVNVIAVEQIITLIRQIVGGLTAFLGSVAFMSVIVAFIGIMTTMFTSVNERTREIGLLKALGLKSRTVMLIFLSEAGLTGLLGGVIGAIVGGGLSFVVLQLITGGFQIGTEAPHNGFSQFSSPAESFFQFSPDVSPQLIFGAIFMAVVVGILAGLIPAWRASKLTPVEALRHE